VELVGVRDVFDNVFEIWFFFMGFLTCASMGNTKDEQGSDDKSGANFHKNPFNI
jgi:hypothetical protein